MRAKAGRDKQSVGRRGGFHQKGSEEEGEWMHFSGRAVMTGPLLKLPLINDLQPIGAETKTLH